MTKIISTKALAGVAILAIAATTPVRADWPIQFESGNWWAGNSVSAHAADGRAMCTLLKALGGPSVALETIADDPGFSLIVSKVSWEIPATVATLPMNISFDGIPATIDGHADRIAEHGMAYAIPPADARAFIHGFTAAKTMTITFDGDEPAWTVDLTGTAGALPAFRACIAIVHPAVLSQLGPPTQPYAVAPPAKTAQ